MDIMRNPAKRLFCWEYLKELSPTREQLLTAEGYPEISEKAGKMLQNGKLAKQKTPPRKVRKAVEKLIRLFQQDQG